MFVSWSQCHAEVLSFLLSLGLSAFYEREWH